MSLFALEGAVKEIDKIGLGIKIRRRLVCVSLLFFIIISFLDFSGMAM